MSFPSDFLEIYESSQTFEAVGERLSEQSLARRGVRQQY